MTSFVHRDRIAEKLEIARTLGLVTDFMVGSIGPVRQATASVRVWRSPTATDATVRHYLARLLEGLVSDREILVTAPFRPGETVPADAPGEPIDQPDPIPVAA